MNELFSHEHIKNVIKNANIVAIEALSDEYKDILQLNLDKYTNDVIDYLNNSNIEDLIFEEDKQFLNLEYIEKEDNELIFLLLNKRKNTICKLFIISLQEVHDRFYQFEPNSLYGKNFSIRYALASESNILNDKKTIYTNKKTEEYIYLETKFKELLHTSKFLNIVVKASPSQMLSYKKTEYEEIKITGAINGVFFKIFPDKNDLKNFDFFYDLVKSDIKKICNVENIDDFKKLIEKVSILNYNIKKLIKDEEFKGISFNKERNSSFITPTINIQHDNLKLKIFTGSYDVEKILNENIYCHIEDEDDLLNIWSLQKTEFKFKDFLKNKNEVLEYLKLQNY